MQKIRSIINKSLEINKQILLDSSVHNKIQKFVDIIVNSFLHNGKVFFCGNGGSAADAQHLAAELSGRFYFDRDPLFADALHVNTSYLTAVANDYSYDEIYSRLVKAKCNNGDVLVLISTSGNSKNIIAAADMAKRLGVITLSLTGKNGGKLKEFSDEIIIIPSEDTPRIQEAHILIGHIICELIEEEIFGNGK